MRSTDYLRLIKNKPNIIVLCGLQCSGKSTYAKKMKEEENYKVVSSDNYRLEHPDWDNDRVFKQLYQDMNKYLSEGHSVILDATNTTMKARKQVFLNIKVPCYKSIVIFNTPYNVCLERLDARNNSDYPHNVPIEVLERYLHSFEIPFYEEGWDFIIIKNEIDCEKSDKNLNDYLKVADGYNQQNKHHTQDLGQHMKTVEQVIRELKADSIVIQAAKYHDVGKLYTQTFGPDGQAHYYNHANVGTYHLMCSSGAFRFNNGDFEYDNEKTLEWLFYINYHMIMHNVKTEKSINKWARIFGQEKFNQLKLLNQADNSNHVLGI